MLRRRDFCITGAGVMIGFFRPNTAPAQGKPKTLHATEIQRSAILTTTIAVEHVTITSLKSFESVKTEIEALIPPIDQSIFGLLQRGEAERAREKMEQAPILSIFEFRNYGALLKVQGLQRKAIQYDIGNPLTASEIAKNQISAALYAPIRVLLREGADGQVAFEYDRPQSVFGQFYDAEVNAVAGALDRNLQAVLQRAAA